MSFAGPHVPLVASALLFAGFSLFEWRRAPVWARIHLGVATAFALASLSHPGMSVEDLVGHGRDGIAYITAAARAAGMVAALVTVATRLREFALR